MTDDVDAGRPLYVVGAGGLGRETLDAILATGYPRPGVVFVDDYLRAAELDGVPVRRLDGLALGRFVVGIADPAIRRDLADRMTGRGMAPATVVHPAATLAHDVTVPDGCIVLAHAFVSTGVVLGAHSQVQYNATVGHDAALSDFVTVLPGANVAGSTTLLTGVTVGSNACVLQGLRVEAGTLVGAGAVVTRSHPACRVLVGVPARPAQ